MTRALVIDGTIEPEPVPASLPALMPAPRAAREGIEITTFGDHAREYLDPRTGERWSVAFGVRP